MIENPQDNDVNDFLEQNSDFENTNNESSLSLTNNTPNENSRILKIKIKKYINSFPNELKDIDISDIEHLSENQLQEKYNEILVSLNNENNSLVGSAYFMGVGLIETISVSSGYVDLSGLTTNCATNPGIKKALTQMSIEYSDYTLLTKPEEKLAYLTLLTILTTYQQNKLMVKNNEQIKKKEDNISNIKEKKNDS